MVDAQAYCHLGAGGVHVRLLGEQTVQSLAYRRIAKLTISSGLLGYPFLVYACIDSHPELVVALLGALGGVRLVVGGKIDGSRIVGLLGLVAFCAAAWWTGTRFELVKLYPLFVSMGGAAYGLWTMLHPPSAVERLAQLSMPNERFDDRKRAYMQRVTAIWVVFFVGNGSAAAYTAVFASTAVWAVYNGLVSYVLIGALFSAEYLFRIWYRKRHYPSLSAG